MYLIKEAPGEIPLNGNWADPMWAPADTLSIRHYRPEGSDHRPEVTVKLLYDVERLHVFFKVVDRYVKCKHTAFQSAVCKDSCVEFFVRPKPDRGYLNFEINCGGTLLLSYVEDWTRTENGFAKFERVDAETAKLVSIYHSLPSLIEEEIRKPVTWYVQYSIAFSLFEKFLGPLGVLSGRIWQANFYKCGDALSHPHWGSWQPVTGALNFHQPDCFGPIQFA